MGGSSPPQPQNPTDTIQQASTANIQAGRSSQAGSMVDQNNFLGSLNYNQIGTDQFGNPMYSSQLQLSPQQQQLYNILSGTQQQAGQQGQSLIQRANYGAQSPTDAIGNQSSGILGQQMNQWLQAQGPWMQQQTEEMDAKLRNQGIFPSPTATNDPNSWGAYERQMGELTQSQQMGVAGAAAQFQPQAFQEASSLYAMPAQLGTQLAQFGQYTSPGQALTQTPGLNIGPADVAGIVSSADQQRLQAWAAQQQQQGSLMQGLFNLGGNVLGGMARGGTGIFGPAAAVAAV